jgi:hypothetical protein
LTWNKEEVNEMQTQKIRKNHMDILWHEYTDKGGEETPVTQASLTEKASIVGRVGIMLLSCGTGAWRVRSSMNALAEEMGITCTADIGLMSIEYTCFDGDDGFTQSLCLTNTGVNTSKLNRLEHFIREFEQGEQEMSGEELHKLLDQIEEIHGLYSPTALGMASCDSRTLDITPSTASSRGNTVCILTLPLLFLVFHLLKQNKILLINIESAGSKVKPAHTVLFTYLIYIFYIGID